jgi:hypothetical protein
MCKLMTVLVLLGSRILTMQKENFRRRVTVWVATDTGYRLQGWVCISGSVPERGMQGIFQKNKECGIQGCQHANFITRWKKMGIDCAGTTVCFHSHQ